MMNKWLLRIGSSVLALSLITGCATNNNDDDDMEPIEDAPLDQDEDIMDDNNQDGNQDDDNNLDENNLDEDNRDMMDDEETNNENR
ncbi:hypothetical protein JYK21_02695 [Ralstonia pickettii]|nr:hypothetical protein [Ralstonia pickettii]